MPTTTERPDGDLDTLNVTLQESFQSWTEDLPICLDSAVGFSTNQVYQRNGVSKEEHLFEDRSFYFCLEDTSLYGVFDGHFGSHAVDFISQRMPPEILLGQLKERKSDAQIRYLLQRAFLSLETSFFQTIDSLLAEKEALKLQLRGMEPHKAFKKHPSVVQRLNTVTAEIESGTTSVVALILKNLLYIANVGDCRAILYKLNESGEEEICQLTVDHTFENEDEQCRLQLLGIKPEILKNGSQNRRHQFTRCLGNYVVKGGYKEFSNLSEATEEPVIASPDVIGGIELDKKCKYLILMSSGIYKTLEQATGKSNVNKKLLELLNEQISKQSCLSDATQAVVDKIGEMHYETYMKNKTKEFQKRYDMTLLVRVFSEEFLKQNNNNLNVNEISQEIDDIYPSDKTLEPMDDPNEPIQNGSEFSAKITSSSGSQLSSQSIGAQDNRRITPYVDFTDFYAAIEEAYEKGEIPEDWRRS